MNNFGKSVEEFLKENGEYVATTVGNSMYPLLKDKKYAVKIVPANGRLKKYDVALFRRGKKLVLHRVIKVYPDGYYIRGDHDISGEYVKDCQIVGVLSEIHGKDRNLKVTDKDYIRYSRLTVLLHPFCKVMRKFCRTVKKILAFRH